jgi:hypothetical protein
VPLLSIKGEDLTQAQGLVEGPLQERQAGQDFKASEADLARKLTSKISLGRSQEVREEGGHPASLRFMKRR